MKALLEHPAPGPHAGMSPVGARLPRKRVTLPPGLSLGGLASRSLELRELRYFQSVARTGNFGRAARELNIGQPNVSHQVQKLEQELGTQLLIRHGRGVTLTRAGSCLMERIDAIMALLSAPLEQAQAPEQTTGTISIALPAEAAPLLVPHLLEACRARWPNVTLNIREGTSASLEEWVLDRRVDIAVLQDPPLLNELDVEPVIAERLGLVSEVRTGWIDEIGPVRVRQLGGLKLILPHPRHWIRRLVDSAAFRRGVVLDRVQQADGVPLIKEMVRNGLGRTVLPYAAVRDEAARGSLLFRPIEHDQIVAVHAIACHGGDAPAPFVTEVRRLLRDLMLSLVTSGHWAGATSVASKSSDGDGDSAGFPGGGDLPRGNGISANAVPGIRNSVDVPEGHGVSNTLAQREVNPARFAQRDAVPASLSRRASMSAGVAQSGDISPNFAETGAVPAAEAAIE
jgi:LysR family transcriptional regulator, nitrogen assimilation regulatory protein